MKPAIGFLQGIAACFAVIIYFTVMAQVTIWCGQWFGFFVGDYEEGLGALIGFIFGLAGIFGASLAAKDSKDELQL